MCSPSQHSKVTSLSSTLTDEETEAESLQSSRWFPQPHISESRNRVGVLTLLLSYLHLKPDVGLSENQVDWLEAVGSVI